MQGREKRASLTRSPISSLKRSWPFRSSAFPKPTPTPLPSSRTRSAWLRKYYPAEYAAALFNSQPMGFYPPHVLVRDSRRRGVEVLPPDINRSDEKCTVVSGAVRIGLNYVKGLGGDEVRKIVAERERGGPFQSLDDFTRRVDLPRGKVERLIYAGAFDSMGRDRRELLMGFGACPSLDRDRAGRLGRRRRAKAEAGTSGRSWSGAEKGWGASAGLPAPVAVAL